MSADRAGRNDCQAVLSFSVSKMIIFERQWEWERCLRTGGKAVSLQSSKRARRRNWEATGQSASPLSVGK